MDISNNLYYDLASRMVALMDSKRGVQAKLAESIGKTSSYFSEIKRGSAVNALHLLAVGKVFGLKTMAEIMGIPIEDHCDGNNDNPMVAELLENARKVLNSGNPVAFDALERNIRYFAHAVEVEKRLSAMESRLERLIDQDQQIRKLQAKCEEMSKQLSERGCARENVDGKRAAGGG
jgi:hypothetical protein